MDREILLTILLVTYNHKDYIKRALDSIIMQKTDFPFKIIILDDCSTDGTTEICQEYANNYTSLIEFAPKKRNVGLINNVFEGFLKIKTSYFAGLDGDDYWVDQFKLQMQIDLLEKNPDCVICGHNTIYDYGNKKEILIGQIIPTIPEIFSLYNNRYLHTSSRIYRNVVNFTKYPKKLIVYDIYLYHIMLDIVKCIYIDKIMSVYNASNPNSVYSALSQDEKIKDSNDTLFNLIKLLDFKYEEHYLKEGLIYDVENYKRVRKIFGKQLGLRVHHYLTNKKLIKKIKHME